MGGLIIPLMRHCSFYSQNSYPLYSSYKLREVAVGLLSDFCFLLFSGFFQTLARALVSPFWGRSFLRSVTLTPSPYHVLPAVGWQTSCQKHSGIGFVVVVGFRFFLFLPLLPPFCSCSPPLLSPNPSHIYVYFETRSFCGAPW